MYSSYPEHHDRQRTKHPCVQVISEFSSLTAFFLLPPSFLMFRHHVICTYRLLHLSNRIRSRGVRSRNHHSCLRCFRGIVCRRFPVVDSPKSSGTCARVLILLPFWRLVTVNGPTDRQASQEQTARETLDGALPCPSVPLTSACPSPCVRPRQTVIVKLSQPFVCQLLLVGCILLNITATLHIGVPSDVVCLARPWMTHVGLTFTSGFVWQDQLEVIRFLL